MDINYEEIILNNEKIKNYIRQKNISNEKIKKELDYLVSSEGFNIHLENKTPGKLIKVGEVQNTILIKSGFYEIEYDKELTSDMSFEQITLSPTEIGKKFFEKYRKDGK